MTTDYVLDINTGLTQILQDGTNTYLYGVNRIAQTTATETEYFLPDALGSVLNLADEKGAVLFTLNAGLYQFSANFSETRF